MGMFLEWLEGIAQRHFGMDQSGRVAFFPSGWRKPGYYVESSDQLKIKALVKMYTVAGALINFVGVMATCALTQWFVLGEHTSPLRRKLELGLSVYSIACLILLVLPALVLWRLYRTLLQGFVSPLTPVGPESITQIQRLPDERRTFLILIAIGAMLILVGVWFAVQYRPLVH